jgi:adenine-specific DNA-methyltransferase
MRTLFDMGVRRLRAAGTEQKAELSQQLLGKDGREHRPDLGFRVLRLTDSNFKIWDASETSDNPDTLAQQLRLYADHVDSDASDLDILYELMLKAGMPLTTPVEEKEVEGRTVYSLADGLLIICLERSLTRGVLRGIQALEPKQVICLDQAFGGNDQLKTNTVLEMRSHDIEFRTV